MPEELANLLIRVSSVGFDEVIERLSELEEVIDRIGSNSALGQISRSLNQIMRDLRDIRGDVAEFTTKNSEAARAVQQHGQALDQISKANARFQFLMNQGMKVVASFWAMVAIPRKAVNSIDQISRFNQQLTLMAINANMARDRVAVLGTTVEGLGGSRGGLASFSNRFTMAMQGLRAGRGAGQFEELATLYGIDFRGSGPTGLATSEEYMRSIAQYFERIGNSEQAKVNKLHIKQLAGLDDGTFRMLDKGVAYYEKMLAKQREYQDRSKGISEAADAWRIEMAEINQEYELLKGQILREMLPYVKMLTGWVKDTLKYLQGHPGVVAAILTGVKAIAFVAAGITFGKAIFGLKQILGLTKSVAEASAGAASSVGGLSNSIGRGASRAAGAAGAVVGSVGSMFVDAYGIYQQNQDMVGLGELITNWWMEWRAVNLRGYLTDRQIAALTDGALANIKSDSIRQSWLNKYKEMNRDARAYDENDKGRGISIESITIEVRSDSADAAKVAEAVRDEFYRQVNEAIDDSQKGGYRI